MSPGIKSMQINGPDTEESLTAYWRDIHCEALLMRMNH